MALSLAGALATMGAATMGKVLPGVPEPPTKPVILNLRLHALLDDDRLSISLDDHQIYIGPSSTAGRAVAAEALVAHLTKQLRRQAGDNG